MQFRTQRGNLLTLCERKTRFTFTAPLPNKQAETTDDALRQILGPLPELARRSVTFDNGSEFAFMSSATEIGTLADLSLEGGEMPSLLIAGASGIVGNATLERALSRNGWTDVVGLSRRRPELDTIRPYRHLSIDLRDADAAKTGLSDVGDITHLAYGAVREARVNRRLAGARPDGDQPGDAQNCLEPLLKSKSLRHVTLLQGTKAYGLHVHPIPIPARERAPRDNHDNFYWLQEDYLKEKAREHGFTWTILRPQLIVGRPWGVAMNLVPIIGAYAAICTEEGLPFSFTGGVPYVWRSTQGWLPR